MNILIIGGLLGLAVLAILGAVLLGISEERSEKAKKVLQERQTSGPALLPQQSQSRQNVSLGPEYQSVPATPVLPRQTITLPVSDADEATGVASLADLNGQVSEITEELRFLAQRAGELQHRLSTLSEMLERQEHLHQKSSQTTAPATDLFSSDVETQVL